MTARRQETGWRGSSALFLELTGTRTGSAPRGAVTTSTVRERCTGADSAGPSDTATGSVTSVERSTLQTHWPAPDTPVEPSGEVTGSVLSVDTSTGAGLSTATPPPVTSRYRAPGPALPATLSTSGTGGPASPAARVVAPSTGLTTVNISRLPQNKPRRGRLSKTSKISIILMRPFRGPGGRRREIGVSSSAR